MDHIIDCSQSLLFCKIVKTECFSSETILDECQNYLGSGGGLAGSDTHPRSLPVTEKRSILTILQKNNISWKYYSILFRCLLAKVHSMLQLYIQG